CRVRRPRGTRVAVPVPPVPRRFVPRSLWAGAQRLRGTRRPAGPPVGPPEGQPEKPEKNAAGTPAGHPGEGRPSAPPPHAGEPVSRLEQRGPSVRFYECTTVRSLLTHYSGSRGCVVRPWRREMRSSNPVFTRRGFSRDGGYAGFNAGPQLQTGMPHAPTNPYAQPGNPYAPQVGPGGVIPGAPARPGVMTIDSVVSRTAITLGTVVVAAAAAWLSDMPVGLGVVFALAAMGLALWQSFRREPSP